MSTEPDYQAIYCQWAEAYYDLAEVEAVSFYLHTEGPWSEVTPDADAYVRVEVRTTDGHVRAYSEDWDTDLMNDILRFAVGQKP